MTRTPFDSFSKQVLETLLAPLGAVTTNREVAGESQYIDVYFIPTPGLDEQAQGLGLLGQMATVPCLIEPFRNQDVQSSIATLSTSQLGVLGEALLDFESISDLTTWLQHLP
jgi:hypothetical protein